MEKSTQGLLAMRALTLIAALVAVGGIITTSVFARRREWAVLRAMGIGNAGLLAALALETLLVMSLGALCGAIGGIVSYRGPTLGFLEAQGYVIGNELQLGARRGRGRRRGPDRGAGGGAAGLAHRPRAARRRALLRVGADAAEPSRHPRSRARRSRAATRPASGC